MEDVIMSVMDLAIRYYDDRQLAHACRVAHYAYEMAFERQWVPEDCQMAYAVGLAHDLLEDTLLTREQLPEFKLGAHVMILTHRTSEETYAQYIDRVLDSKDDYAILVKRADMKDHFSQVDSLTDKLKEKYLPFVGKFL